MTFSGKRYRRVRCENVDELILASGSNENLIVMLKSNAPIFSFTRLDDTTLNFSLEMPEKTITHKIKLGEDHIMERRDGTKVNITYKLESENVLKQVITPKEGKIAYFKREFKDDGAVMTIRMEDTDIEAKVYYEQLQ